MIQDFEQRLKRSYYEELTYMHSVVQEFGLQSLPQQRFC